MPPLIPGLPPLEPDVFWKFPKFPLICGAEDVSANLYIAEFV